MLANASGIDGYIDAAKFPVTTRTDAVGSVFADMISLIAPEAAPALVRGTVAGANWLLRETAPMIDVGMRSLLEGQGLVLRFGGTDAIANAAAESTSIGLGSSRVVSPETVRSYLVDRMGWSEARAVAYIDSFEGPITARISRPGESYLRYFDGESGEGNFVTRNEFFSPVDARGGLNLDPDLTANLATSQQAVTSTQRSIVFEGGVRDGGFGVRQTLITDRMKFLFGPGYRYY